MFDSLILSLNIVLPLFVLMLIGYLLRYFKLVDEHTLKGMNVIVFRVLLPITLFQSLIKTNIEKIFNPQLIIFAISAVLIAVLFFMLVYSKIEKDPKKVGVMVQGSFRSNYILLGLPIAMNIYDDVGVVSLLIAFIVPLYNVIAVIILEYYSGGEINLKQTLIKTIKNPIIIGAILGVIVLVSGIQLPSAASKVVSSLAYSATPIALMVLGGMFEFHAVKKNLRNLSIIVIMKLILLPLIGSLVAYTFGFRGIELVALLLMFGSPVAVSSYPMAVVLNCDGELASQAVLVSTLASVFTFFFWVFGFRLLDLL